MPPSKRPAIGRGLDSLIAMDDAPARDASAINEIEISRISPNPDQPRTIFDEEALEELSRFNIAMAVQEGGDDEEGTESL